MQDLGVTDQQFLDACKKASKNPIHKKIVDQISAVDNFVAFKKLMIKRNQELNQQTLAAEKVLESQAQTIPLKTAGQEPKAVKPAQTEQEAMREALKVAQEIERMEEEEMIRRAIEES